MLESPLRNKTQVSTNNGPLEGIVLSYEVFRCVEPNRGLMVLFSYFFWFFFRVFYGFR